MRTAHSGRAAAYFAKHDYEKALVDQNMVVLIYALEVEITNELDAPDRDKLMREAAGAYRMRADMLIAAAKVTQAEVDLIRAETLEADARKETGAEELVKSGETDQRLTPALSRGARGEDHALGWSPGFSRIRLKPGLQRGVYGLANSLSSTLSFVFTSLSSMTNSLSSTLIV